MNIGGWIALVAAWLAFCAAFVWALWLRGAAREHWKQYEAADFRAARAERDEAALGTQAARKERDDARAQRDRLNSENALHHEANTTLSQEIRRLEGVVAQLQAQIAAHDEPAPAAVTPEQEYHVNVPAAKPTRPSRTRGARVTHKEGSVQAESVGEMPAPHLE